MKRRRANESRGCDRRSASTRKRRSEAEPVTVRGRVTRLFISEPRYTAGRFKADDGIEITFAGSFMCAERDPLVLVGRWVQHPRFGQQLRVDSFRFDDRCESSGRRGDSR